MLGSLDSVMESTKNVTGYAAGSSSAGSSRRRPHYRTIWRNRLKNYPAYFTFRQTFDNLAPEERERLERLLENVKPSAPNENVSREQAARLLGRAVKSMPPILAGAPSVWDRDGSYHRKLFDREAVLSAFYNREKNKRRGGPKSRLSAKDLEEIVLLANCGVARRELTKLYHLSDSSISVVLDKASKLGAYDKNLVKEVKLRNAIMAYKTISENIRQPVESYIKKFLVSVPSTFSPYVRLLNSIRPGTSEYLQKNFAQEAKQTAILQTFDWLKQADFAEQAEGGRADVVTTVRSHLEEFYEGFFGSLIPKSLLDEIDTGLSELEQSTGAKTKKILNGGTVVRQYFFEGKNTLAIARDSGLTRSAVGQHLSKGVDRLRDYIDRQLGYGNLEALLKASMEERLRTNA